MNLNFIKCYQISLQKTVLTEYGIFISQLNLRMLWIEFSWNILSLSHKHKLSLSLSSIGPYYTLFIRFYYISNDSLIQWRAVIGIHNCWSSLICINRTYNLPRNIVSMLETLFLCYHYFENTYISLLTFLYIFVFLYSHEDIEINPGLKKLKI